MRGFSAIGLYNPVNIWNIGGAMRAAFCYDAKLAIVEGSKYKKNKTDTCSAYKHIPIINGKILDNIPYKATLIGVELTHKSRNIINYCHPESAIYVFGPENGSLPPEILDQCRDIISIPTKICMNLAACVNVVLYDRLIKNER